MVFSHLCGMQLRGIHLTAFVRLKCSLRSPLLRIDSFDVNINNSVIVILSKGTSWLSSIKSEGVAILLIRALGTFTSRATLGIRYSFPAQLEIERALTNRSLLSENSIKSYYCVICVQLSQLVFKSTMKTYLIQSNL